MHKQLVHEMLENIVKAAHSEIAEKGIHNVDTKEFGDVTDMIKDLCEAEEKIYKTCYYKKIVEAMEESEKEDELMLKMMIEEHGEVEGRMGYDRWRNSRGRFAPKGTGHETSMAMATGRSGYDPRLPNAYYDDPRTWTDPWASTMGYDGSIRNVVRSNATGTNRNGSEHIDTAGRMGYTPDDMRTDVNKDTRSQYQDARRHYHETNSQDDKMKMDAKADEYLHESIETMRDIFVQSDPKMQQKMREDLARLFREMGGK